MWVVCHGSSSTPAYLSFFPSTTSENPIDNIQCRLDQDNKLDHAKGTQRFDQEYEQNQTNFLWVVVECVMAPIDGCGWDGESESEVECVC